jgi:hypothetical protein
MQIRLDDTNDTIWSRRRYLGKTVSGYETRTLYSPAMLQLLPRRPGGRSQRGDNGFHSLPIIFSPFQLLA